MQPGTAPDRPRFRQDLVAEPIDDSGARFIDVMDPDSGNVFRFYEVEYSLACAMDGERDVPGIVQWAKEELGLVPSANEVKTVIATLGHLGYLDRTITTAAAAAAPAPTPAVIAAKPARVADDDLRPGVHVGPRRAVTPVPDMELGHAGSSAPHVEQPMAAATEIELSHGVTAARKPRSVDATQVDDIALGVSGGGVDVSVDLSDQVAPSVADVKEAVRASQVMKAVDISPELAAALEEPEAPVQKQPAAARPQPEPRPPERQPEARPQMPTERPVVQRPVEARPEQRPEARPPVAPPAPEPRVSRALLVVFAIVIVAAAAFVVYKIVLKKSEDEQQSQAPVVPPPPVKPTPPPPPPVESQKLATSPESSESIKPVAAGVIETIHEGQVKSGDVIVQFAGHKPIETEVKNLEHDIETRVKPEIAAAEKERDAAQTAGNKAKVTETEGRIAERKKSLDDKQGKLTAKKSELDRFQLKAPADGKLTAKSKVGARVTPSDEIATLVHSATRVAKFTKADGGLKTRVVLVSKGDGKKLSCIVAMADASGITVECPADAAPEGTEVTFGGVDTSPPPEVDMTEPAAGSAGSAAAVPPPPPPARPTPRPAPGGSRPPPAHPPAGSATGSAEKTEPAPAPTPTPAAGSNEAPAN